MVSTRRTQYVVLRVFHYGKENRQSSLILNAWMRVVIKDYDTIETIGGGGGVVVDEDGLFYLKGGSMEVGLFSIIAKPEKCFALVFNNKNYQNKTITLFLVFLLLMLLQ